MRVIRTGLTVGWVLAVGCASVRPPLTALELSRAPSRDALLQYLAQPDASSQVCDFAALGEPFSEDIAQALVDGLLGARLAPPFFEACVERAVEALSPEPSATLFDALLAGQLQLLRARSLEQEAPVQARLQVLHRLVLERPRGTGPHPPKWLELTVALRRERALGAVAARFAAEVLDVDAAEREGSWRGAPVDLALLDTLATAGELPALTRLSLRLENPALRYEAQLRVVRAQAVRSPFAEVRTAPDSLERAVVATGANPVEVAEPLITRAWLKAAAVPVRQVWVRQRVWESAATLLGAAPERAALSVLPELSLRQVLWVQLSTLSLPITLCASAVQLDPTPCIAPSLATIAQPLVQRDARGRFHVREELSLEEAAALAARGSLSLPVQLGARDVGQLEWPLHFEAPQRLEFAAGTATTGPPLGVRIDVLPAGRVAFAVATETGSYRAIVEAEDLSAFAVESRGGAGFDGHRGVDGSPGFDGAECSDGGRGQDGSRGGDGLPGADGGPIDVTVSCGAADCSTATLEALAQVVRSVGGSGGEGGRGGEGGSGGSGGRSRSARSHRAADGSEVVDDPGCSSGWSGSTGDRGGYGFDGRDGRPGRVTWTRVAPAVAN